MNTLNFFKHLVSLSPQIFIVLFILHKDYVFFNLFSINSYDFLKKVYFSKTSFPIIPLIRVPIGLKYLNISRFKCIFHLIIQLNLILYIKKELSQYTVLFTIIYEKLQLFLVPLIPVFLLYVNLCPTVDFLFEFFPNTSLVCLSLKTFV